MAPCVHICPGAGCHNDFSYSIRGYFLLLLFCFVSLFVFVFSFGTDTEKNTERDSKKPVYKTDVLERLPLFHSVVTGIRS